MTLNQMLGFVPRMKQAALSFARTFHAGQTTDTEKE